MRVEIIRDHNGLEDAELTAECYARIIYGNILEEPKKYSEHYHNI